MKSVLKAASAALVCSLACSAGAVNVLILSSGNGAIDETVEAVLEAHGHAATVGPGYPAFDGTFDLTGYDVIYFQANANWNFGDMPDAGQSQLVAWVQGGHGLVTSEWVKWKTAVGQFQTLGVLLPVSLDDSAYTSTSVVTYSVEVADATLNAGVPASFEFAPDSFSGTESQLQPASGATVFYGTSTYPDTGGGLVGWQQAQGRVLSLSVCAGQQALVNADFAQLLSNCMGWAAQEGSCRADFDGDGFVTGLDFDAFVAAFEAGDPSSDFDGDGFVTGLDFDGYVRAFEAGCD